MHLAAVDNLAVNHSCWLQQGSPLAKLLLIFWVLAVLLSTTSLAAVGFTALVILLVAATNRLPLASLAGLAMVPMLLAALFAFSLADWYVGWLLVGRAGTAAATVVVVAMTTPPLRLLTLLSAPLPRVLGELMYFTYRSVFLISGGVATALEAVRQRRGREPWGVSRFRTLAQVFGMALVRSWDLAGRQYEAVRLRGVSQGFSVQRDWRLRLNDLPVLATGLLVTAGWYFV